MKMNKILDRIFIKIIMNNNKVMKRIKIKMKIY